MRKPNKSHSNTHSHKHYHYVTTTPSTIAICAQCDMARDYFRSRYSGKNLAENKVPLKVASNLRYLPAANHTYLARLDWSLHSGEFDDLARIKSRDESFCFRNFPTYIHSEIRIDCIFQERHFCFIGNAFWYRNSL